MYQGIGQSIVAYQPEPAPQLQTELRAALRRPRRLSATETAAARAARTAQINSGQLTPAATVTGPAMARAGAAGQPSGLDLGKLLPIIGAAALAFVM